MRGLCCLPSEALHQALQQAPPRLCTGHCQTRSQVLWRYPLSLPTASHLSSLGRLPEARGEPWWALQASQTKPRGSAAAFSTNSPQPWGFGGCLCACVCECVSVSLHACVSCVCARVPACLLACLCVCVSVCMSVPVCMPVCACPCASLSMYVFACLFLCVHVGLRVSVHLCALRVYLISVCVCVRVAVVFLNYLRAT